MSLTVADLPKPTVAAQNRHPVRVAVIPFTLEATTLGSLRVGDSVNIECDSIAKMVQRLVDLPAESENKQTSREGAGTLEQLLRSGF